MPGGIARSLRVTAQRSGQGSKTAAKAASAAQVRADLDGENGVARWVQQQASPHCPDAPIGRSGFRTSEIPGDGATQAAHTSRERCQPCLRLISS